MKTALTINEAIAEGYKYCNIEECGDGTLVKLSDIVSGEVIWDPLETTFYLCDKEPSHHSIDPGQIEDLIQENIDATEDYYKEDGFNTALEGCDDLIKQLSERINKNLLKHNFYFNGDIKLLPNP